MEYLKILLLLLIISTPLSAQTFEQNLEKDLKKVELKGIPVDYLETMAILETGHGRGRIYRQTHNLFSIKSSKQFRGSQNVYRTGQLIYLQDTDSILAVVQIISGEPKYRVAYQKALEHNPKEFFKELKKAGYAVDKHYAEKLLRIYNEKFL